MGVSGGFGVTAEADFNSNVRTPDLPWIFKPEPIVSQFDLPAIVDSLVEDSEFVANPVADRRNSQGSHEIEVTSREPSKTTVSETGFALLRNQTIEVAAEFCYGLANRSLDLQVEKVIGQMRPEQELG